MEFVSLWTWSVSCPSQTHCWSPGTNTGWVTKKTIPLDMPVVSLFLSVARSFCVSLRGGWITFLFLASNVSLSHIGARAHAHIRTDLRSHLWHTHTHTLHTVWQILPSAKKSINKCIVSSLSAVGISLSKLSEKAVECEIEFRTVRCARGAQDERMFAYLFILQQHSVAVLQERVS